MLFKADEKHQPALLAALVHIQTHLDGDLALPVLAERAGFSPYHFHRLFTAYVGEPVKEYVRRLRLERGAYRLKISQTPVLEIALEAGFKTHETFTRAFARRFGMPPSAYRQDFLSAARDRRQRLQLERRPPPVFAADAALLPNGVTEARVRLERVRPLLVAFIRHVGPYASVLEPGSSLASLWEALFAWGRAQGLVGPDSLLIGVPQDDPSVTPPAKQRFDVCIQTPEFRRPAGGIGAQTLSPGLYGVGRHYGSFENLAATYAHVYDACVLNGAHQLRAAPPFEVYGHTRVNDDLRIDYIDVFLPLEPAAGRPRP